MWICAVALSHPSPRRNRIVLCVDFGMMLLYAFQEHLVVSFSANKRIGLYVMQFLQVAYDF
jgi:hypothetical protein